jgi:pimeloyl-ACP methyl ester carboxylesterase
VSEQPTVPTVIATEPATEPLIVVPFGERRLTFTSQDDVTVHGYDWGGDGPPLIFAHATGLHAHVWIPLVTHLREHFHCYGVDVRAQGNTLAPSNGELHWSAITADFVAALDGFNLSGRGDVFGIGHSQGGFAVITSELERPGTFRHIFGFEPVIFPLPNGTNPYERLDNHMSTVASKRREIFDSRVAAYDNYRAKLPFKSADDEVTRAYVQWGFNDLPDGTVRLKCRAANEAELFARAATGVMDELPKVNCEVTLGLSEFTTPNFAESVPMQCKALPKATLMEFPGRSHFGVLENTEDMARILINVFLGEAAR